MEQHFKVDGMTCNGCKAGVEKYIGSLSSVQSVSVDLENGKATLSSHDVVPLASLRAVLPEKYDIQLASTANSKPGKNKLGTSKQKLKQLYPLFLIFTYLIVSSNLLHWNNWSLQAVMFDFMGLFYIVFSFFKFLDLKGFPDSFRMYDPLAQKLPIYAWIYPFLELAMGLMFLMRYQIQWALVGTLLLLSITTIGVLKSLLDKKAIRCACLGTALKLPMTEATLIENILMIGMAITILYQNLFV